MGGRRLFRVGHDVVPRLCGRVARVVWLDGQDSVRACGVGFERGRRGGVGVADLVVRSGVLFRDMSVGRVSGCGVAPWREVQEEPFPLFPGVVMVALCRAGGFRRGFRGGFHQLGRIGGAL